MEHETTETAPAGPIPGASFPPSLSFPAEPEDTSRAVTGALRYPNFRLLLGSVFLSGFSEQMLAVAIGWELYNRTGSALVLGGVGLAQVIPLMLLFLPAGYAADQLNRKYLLAASQAIALLATLGLAVLSFERGPLLAIYACLVLLGAADCFRYPTSSSLVSQVLPEAVFENAVTWRSSANQLSSVLGPAAGGLLIGLFGGAGWVYVLSGLFFLVVVVLLLITKVGPQKGPAAAGRKLGALVEGVRFLGRTQVLLAAITLDLFAVLLGGAVTLLPIFAKDILHVGPSGLGWLQAASSLGAVGMALFLSQRPPFKRAGPALLLAVGGFGVATIIFGFSQWFWLSFLMLLVLGALDNISVVVRSTLLLVRAPDEMRGRVSAVSSLFVGTSNQLGGFESGVVAQLLGPVGSVVIGGIGTVLVVALVAAIWPEMRHLGTLRE
ncbi:MAG TPA: MFS transporter [Ktedonobacterales bacterium]